MEYMAITSVSYIQSFVDSLELNLECQDLARVLFKSEDCCKTFYIGFLNRNRYVIDDLLDYRENKIENINITLDQFLDMCYNVNMLEAIETCFLQPITLLDVALIDKALSNGRTSLEVIYSEFQRNPNKNILKNVL
jgi:hypothetical protein